MKKATEALEGRVPMIMNQFPPLSSSTQQLSAELTCNFREALRGASDARRARDAHGGSPLGSTPPQTAAAIFLFQPPVDISCNSQLIETPLQEINLEPRQ
jgi:hypothetical protein